MKPQGLVAQDIPTESLQQLYNCHNNVKSEVQTKLISLQVNLVLMQINVRFKRGFLKFMRYFYLKTFNFTCNTFFSIILYETITNVDMRISCENLNSMHTCTHAVQPTHAILAIRRCDNPLLT